MRRAIPILIAAVVLAATQAGVAGSTVPSAGSGNLTAAAATAGAVGSSATPRHRARARALRKCRKLRASVRRASCLRRVRKRFASEVVPQQGPIAARIDVRDKYFSPALASIRVGQSILWSWNAVNADAHNVDLTSPPSGVNRLDFSTPNSPSVGFEFRRTFRVPGTYGFVCSIHHNMTMTVQVSR